MLLNQKGLGCIILASAVHVGAALAENTCDFTPKWEPHMSKKINAELSKNMDRTQDTVIEILEKRPWESGQMKVWYHYGNNWECNYAEIETPDGIQYVSAKHCVGDDFQDIFNDIWMSNELHQSWMKIRVHKGTQKNLVTWNTPAYDEHIEIRGCTGGNGNCYSIRGNWSPIYRQENKLVEGIWVSETDYKKFFEEKSWGTHGLSGSPVLNSEWEIFGVVSAIAQAGFYINEKWVCTPSKYAIWVGKLEHKPKILSQKNSL